jgi:hypothetical protein
MLPTQGQGASQSIEDAVCAPPISDYRPPTNDSQEALGAFFAHVDSKPTAEQVYSLLKVSKI